MPANADVKQVRPGQFQPGKSGNPAGKAKGCLHRATRAAMALLDGEAEALTRIAVERALAGDMVALRLCLERIAPPRKDHPISIELPPINRAEDVVVAMAAVTTALAAGELTPTEASSVAAILESNRRALETEDLDRRLSALEANHARP
jgi:hypothetical protein